MVQEEGKKEDEFGLTPEGDALGYISQEQALVLVIRHAQDRE